MHNTPDNRHQNQSKERPSSSWRLHSRFALYVLSLAFMFYCTGTYFRHAEALRELYLQPTASPSAPTPQLHFYPPGRFAVPPTWADLTTKHPHLQLPAPRAQRRNRAFVSSLPVNTSDGLGHRFTMINMELYIAIKLNVSYIHRVSRYASLSPDHDPKAVERLFGWWQWNDTRDELMDTECANYTLQPSPEQCRDTQHVCVQLAQQSVFKHLVHVPTDTIDCFLSKSIPKQTCVDALAAFAELHNEPDTLFQMQASTKWCPTEHRYGDFTETSTWLREHYWHFHENTTLLDGEYVNDSMMVRRFEKVLNEDLTRILPFSENRVQIAVHIRRGDFFNYTSRVIIPDDVYADTIAITKNTIDDVFGGDIGTTVSIFSEGVVRSGQYRSMHDIGRMESLYVTNEGNTVKQVDEHWQNLLAKRLKRGSDLSVQSFIATDTVSTVHTMLAADVFIGSLSGLSAQIASVLSRGVVIMPYKVGADGKLRPSEHMNLRFNFGEDMKTSVDEDVLKKSVRSVLEEHVKKGVIHAS